VFLTTIENDILKCIKFYLTSKDSKLYLEYHQDCTNMMTKIIFQVEACMKFCQKISLTFYFVD